MLAVGDPHGVSRRHLAAGQIGAITLVILGGTVLAGWFLDLEPLKSILPGYISMKVNTAIAFICAGGALTLILRNPRDRVTNLAAAVLGSGVFLIGFLTLTQYVFHVNLGIDELIVRDPHQLLYPGRVAPIAAVNFCFSGVALLLLARSKELAKWSQLLALATGFSALLGIVGYAYGVPVLYGSLGYTSMALHTGIGFVVLSAALLCCQPELGLMSVITAHNPGGWLSRRLIPIAVAVPPVAGALLLRFSASLGGMQMTIVAIVVLQVVLFVALTWVLSFLIERSETRVEIVEEQHVRTQEALSRSEELLRQSQKMEAVGQLAAGIAHDFNNLLSVIVGYSEILVQDPSTPEAAHKKLERIRQAGQSAASLTRQLLAFSRQELVQPKVLDVNAVIRYTEGVLRRLTKEDVQFELTLASNVHP
ncbi:MAG TPA: histidine kinase dimerization/phospho-acceptor domain-containing protein, partial [Alphaproteobacteria bacterium]|nr:histidine kinase dimerization/phospho-acceptor domain-containing protein [Alphaproteobacteria bacterium]